MTSATRELLADRYQLTERIATGGMGVVWRARDERLDRDVAVKLIRPEYSDDPTFRQRLRQEARATAAISDPHVVRLHDVCEQEDPDGGYRAFIVMELVDGQPLSAVLRDGRLPIPVTVRVVQQAAMALAAAHERRIIHRDIKPGNLMVDREGRVTVLDFGIARAADAVALTATDLVLGTPRYLSPEQADGRGSSAASDVYSLGVVAFECLAGVVPYDAGSDVAVALAHLREPVPPLPRDVPAPLARLVERMLAKDPADRPAAREVADALATSNGDETEPLALLAAVTSQPASPHQTLLLPRRDRLVRADLRDTRSVPLRPAMAVSAVAVAVVLLIAAAIAGGPGGTPQAAGSGTTTNHTVADHSKPPAVMVQLDPTLYIGQQWPAVAQQVQALGLTPIPQYAGDGPGQTVVYLSPSGAVRRGSAITVVVSRLDTAGPPHGGPKPVPPGHADKHGQGDQGDG